jgi:hypothetical protein
MLQPPTIFAAPVTTRSGSVISPPLSTDLPSAASAPREEVAGRRGDGNADQTSTERTDSSISTPIRREERNDTLPAEPDRELCSSALHAALGHLGLEKLTAALQATTHGSGARFDLKQSFSCSDCEACLLTKSRRAAHNKTIQHNAQSCGRCVGACVGHRSTRATTEGICIRHRRCLFAQRGRQSLRYKGRNLRPRPLVRPPFRTKDGEETQTLSL